MSFGSLPILSRISVGVTLITAWIVFEETIVDRHGLWRLMPGYKVGDPCLWDAAALLLTIGVLIVASRCKCMLCGAPGT